MRFVLFIALATHGMNADHDFFEYEDCGEACTVQRFSCIISEAEDGKFITKCTDSQECRASEDNNVVCLMPGHPPLGGQDLWPDFHRRVYPSTTPRPESQENCSVWKITTGVGFGCFLILMSIYAVRKIVTILKSRSIVIEQL